jgi:hypothetical protein
LINNNENDLDGTEYDDPCESVYDRGTDAEDNPDTASMEWATATPIDEACTSINQCGAGQGDCDSDEDCVDDLWCSQRENGDPAPGIAGAENLADDYFGDGRSIANWDFCAEPCAISASNCNGYRLCKGGVSSLDDPPNKMARLGSHYYTPPSSTEINDCQPICGNLMNA